jgi:protein-disulfide isomerase
VALEAELRGGKPHQRVKADFMSGVRSGVNGTPTFFINGQRFDGDWRDDRILSAALVVAGK